MSLEYDRKIESCVDCSDSAKMSPAPDTDFCPVVPVRITTESSLWYLVPDEDLFAGKYLRSPKVEASRPPEPSIKGRLDDGQWKSYEYARWTNRDLYPGQLRLNIKPVDGPADGYGILTGAITEVRPL